MTSREFIEQQIAAGYKVHYNKGVWWQRIAPFFYKPVVHFQKIMPGESSPKFSKAFLGFNHLVTDKKFANQSWPVMVLNEKKLKEYTIYSLPTPKRARIRKGLKMTEIKRIENIESVIEDLKNICISTRMRIEHGRPVHYYKTEEWRSWITKEFSLPKREWWGAYYQNSLIAYIYAVPIDETMFIYAAKSITEHLDKCPNDALIFSFLNYCKELPDCNQVMFGDGGPTAPGVNLFKEKLGFEEINLPVYTRYNPLVLMYKIRRLSLSQIRS